MTDAEKAELEQLKKENADFKEAQKEDKSKAEIEALKKQIADFAAKETATKKAALKVQVEGLKFDADKTKSTIEFGENLLDKSPELYEAWLAQLPKSPATPPVKNGSVAAKEFAAGAGEDKKTLDSVIAEQFNSFGK